MRRMLWCAALVLSAALAGAGEDEIQQAEKGWAAAVTTRDFAALDKILGDQLIYAHSTGAIESKGEYLSRLQSGAQKYDTIQHETTTVRMYGGSAVAHSKARMTGTSNGQPFHDRLMIMHFWVKQNNLWRLVAHQTTKIQ